MRKLLENKIREEARKLSLRYHAYHNNLEIEHQRFRSDSDRQPVEGRGGRTYRVLDRASISQAEPLLIDVYNGGKLTYEQPSIEEMRALRQADLERLDPGVRRIVNPHIYHVSLTQRLWDLKQSMIESFAER